METFVWNECFVTGLETVDAQHRRLVDIINRVGDVLLAGDATESALQEIFQQLADYARYHFGEEERLMAAAQIDAAYVAAHKHRHREFIEQVTHMWQARGSMAAPAETLHGFLSAWLAFHILDEDQAMARQIAAIGSGKTAKQAYAGEMIGADHSVGVLLTALNKLYHLLSVQNRDLANANRTLEERVLQRTRELSEANVQLTAEQEKLKSLLQKLEATQSQMLQSEKMAAIGQLAAGVAHEINNPIGFVNSNLGTLRKYVGQFLQVIDRLTVAAPEQAATIGAEIELDYLRSDVQALLAESQDGLTRIKKIVQDLKDFSHIDKAEWQDADLNAGLESTLNMVWNELKYKAEVIRDYGDLPLVRSIPGQLNQVFMNLLVNAAQAIEKRGTITVRSGRQDDQVWIEISDSGAGMTAEVQQHLFEPFFTTKPVGKGTGLGLSLSYDIVVKRHAGRIDVDSAPGRGTTFRITLPIAGAKPNA
ncbi:MAG: bacteriohemerythrin [Rhodocyclaceae bacterium]|nr:bacteriohemerythrin [Rhodocyclaceae bacterium]